MIHLALLAVLLATLSGCTSTLPVEPPPLVDMEEPIALKAEPDDEAARVQLPLGAFSGIYARSAWFEEPDEPGQAPDCLAIEHIVENSPAVAAGLREGDLLLAATLGGQVVELRYPAQWRKLELQSGPGTILKLSCDRAGKELTAQLTLAARLAPARRDATETFRETNRAGIVVRTATEVEARKAGLGAGAGAVLIGMAASSPWRQHVRFGDLIVATNGTELHHPQGLLAAIRNAESDLEIAFVRAGARHTARIAMTRRASGLSRLSIPLLFSYETSRDRTTTSFLFGFLAWETTPAAWSFDFLWWTWLQGGDRDVLVEVKR